MKKGTLARPLVVLDLADVEKSPDKVAAALLSAAENEGFFYLVGHGVPQSEVDAAFALSREFFHSPEEVKRQTRGETSNAHYVLGYTTEELEEGTMRQGLLCGGCPCAVCVSVLKHC
jgi:isopenicillin N synthase-like dioxygenase